MKKLVSLILALAVALSLMGAAFAEEPVTITYATFSASGALQPTIVSAMAAASIRLTTKVHLFFMRTFLLQSLDSSALRDITPRPLPP